jgi:hypothetical protein
LTKAAEAPTYENIKKLICNPSIPRKGKDAVIKVRVIG